MLNPARTETVSARYRALEEMGTARVLDALLEGQTAATEAVRRALPALDAAIGASVPLLRAPEARLIYCGAGTSGRVAMMDAVELNPTFSWPQSRIKVLLAGGLESFEEAREGAEDDAEAARAELSALKPGPGDIVIGIAASGTTPYTLAAITLARSCGALTIALANNPDTPLLQAAEHPVLLDTGPEVLAGSTRLAAGTSQKMALNLFSTAVMVALGKVYRGQMVDMRATNAKLVKRAIAIVTDIAGNTEDAARAALEATDFRLKDAILVSHGATPDEASALLEEADGNLSQAMRQLQG